MKLVDLSHVISPNMPVYPGTEAPVFKTGCTIEEDGFLEKEITFYSHTGTHIDAPAHLVEGHKTLDELQIDHFFGDALLIDFSDRIINAIPLDDLKAYASEIDSVDFLLFNTGWSRFWGTKTYYSGYPILSEEAADWLTQYQLKGIGFDTISVDTAETENFEIHKILFRNKVIIIENLANLDQVGTRRFKFSCFPLNIQQADGSPVRAIAYLNNS